MDVIAEFSLESVEQEDHLSDHIAAIARIIDEEGLEFEVGPAGTTIVGEIQTVLDCVARCHQEVGDGRRIKSVVQLDARDDWPSGSIETQAEKVREQLAGANMA